MTPEELPKASIVVPMLNELGYIDACLDGFARQTYPMARLEVLVVDGGSDDGSRRRVEVRAKTESWIRIVENPRRKASAAFNRGLEAATGEVVFLFSAHGVPDADYVERSVEVLMETGAVGVGGEYRHEGLDPSSQSIGLAMVSPFGMASPHRFARARKEVDTISHPAYWRSALVEIGGFDERLERNSDYELNWRLRAAGHRLVFDPSIGSLYRPRPSLSRLAQQFWWYGHWKVKVIERHPDSLQPRHLVAPVATAGAISSPFLLFSRTGRRLVGLAALAYAAMLVGAVRHARPREHDASVPALAAAFPVMHASWGGAFLVSLAELVVRRGRRS